MKRNFENARRADNESRLCAWAIDKKSFFVVFLRIRVDPFYGEN